MSEVYPTVTIFGQEVPPRAPIMGEKYPIWIVDRWLYQGEIQKRDGTYMWSLRFHNVIVTSGYESGRLATLRESVEALEAAAKGHYSEADWFGHD